MGMVSGIGAGQGQTQLAVDMALLKQSQDLMKQQGAALLAALPPPPPAPSPAGVGGRIDLQA